MKSPAMLVFGVALTMLGVTGVAWLDARAARQTRSIDTSFVVPVPTGSRTVDIGVAGFTTGSGAAAHCVLVSETGSLAVLPGACPRMR